jgi:phosphoribosylanthranilate isomerase
MAVVPQVKICGLRRYEDARAALDAGAWALGFIFHPSSKRYIDPAAAAKLIARLPREALCVGVFVDYELEALHEVVRSTGLRGVQLHGNESPEYARQVEAELVVRALRVGEGFEPASVDVFGDCRILLDTYDAAAVGGTGRAFDWSIARRVGERAAVILAGGLTPENVGEALTVARPAAVDVAGGVEQSHGVKDHDKLRRFFAAVRGES